MDFSEYERAPGKKLGGIAFVILLHVLIVYALMTGLARKVVEAIKAPIETKIIEEIKPPPPPDLPSPPPPPKMVAPPPPPFIPPPEVQVATPPPQNTIAAVTSVKPESPVFAPPQPPAPAAPAQGPAQVSAVIDFSTCSRPEYPRNSLRNAETGIVTLQFLIGVDGRVMDSKVQKSSGFKDLDRAAQRALGQCRFKPGLVNGQPQQSWSSVEYVWQLD